MKLQELKNKFKSKFAVRVIAGVLTITMLATGASVYNVYAEKNNIETVDKEATEKKDTVEELVDNQASAATEKNVDKEETVYLISNASGDVKKTIVSDHLLNGDKAKKIKDKSNLENIKNVKGNEKFDQSGDKLTWEANGEEIYYQGTTTKEAPVSQKVTYYLDGKKISPKKLAGKSGRVTIHYDYKNNSKYTETVNGEEVTVCVPFAAITGIVFDKNFSNVEVTNGKLINSGEGTMVVGYALPGVKDSLGVTDKDFNEKVNIPDSFEVSADVKNFKLETAMTAVVNGSNLMNEEASDTSDIDSMLNELTDATSKLQEGSGDLADGLDTLDSSFGQYSDGVSTLQSGIKEYTDGVSKVATGADQLNNGLKTFGSNLPTLTQALQQLTAGIQQANAGSQKLVAAYKGDGTAQNPGLYNVVQALKQGTAGLSSISTSALTDGIDQNIAGLIQKVQAATGSNAITVDNYSTAIDNAVKQMLTAGGGTVNSEMAQNIYALGQAKGALDSLVQVKANLSKATEGLSKLSDLQTAINGLDQYVGSPDNPNSLYGGTVALANGLGQISDGTAQLGDKLPQISQGVNKLVDGTQQLSDGSNLLVANSGKLNDGANQLKDATGQLSDGIAQLKDGSHQLADGIVQFNAEGITEIVNAYNGDLKPLGNKLQAMIDAGKDYQTFTGNADGTNGNVKFVYKLESIKKN